MESWHGKVICQVAGLLCGIVLAPLLPGVIARVKAFFAGRRGPKLMQCYFDIVKLLRKSRIYSTTAANYFPALVIASLASLLVAGLLLPWGGVMSPLGFTGDALLFAGLLGFSRMTTVLTAMNSASSFEGMGASREMEFSVLNEAAFFAILSFLAVNSGSLELSHMLGGGLKFNSGDASLLLAAAGFFIFMVSECCRVPVDDPETHLELTMIHEAMILDLAGPELALAQYGAAFRLWLLGGFGVMLLAGELPDMSNFATLCCQVAGVIAVVAGVGVVESCMARYRLIKVPQLLGGAFVLAVLALVLSVLSGGGVR